MLINLESKSVTFAINNVLVASVENVSWLISGNIYVVGIVQT